MASQPEVNGAIAWQDLTVKDAAGLRAFYGAVAGWTFSEQSMGGYADYNVHAADGTVIAGLCHARGTNAAAPPQWLVYVRVPSVQAAVAAAKQAGGTVLDGPRPMGDLSFCALRDPAGAAFAVIGGA